ncbi:hypothetical protein [Pedobacter sp. NJ-S-72]
MFDLLNATPLLKATENSDYSILSSQKLKLINHSFNRTAIGISAVQTLNVTDVIDTGVDAASGLKRVTYLSETVDLLNYVTAITGSVTADTRSYPSVSGAVSSTKTYQLPDAYYYSLQLFRDDTQSINGLLLKAKDGSTPNKIILGLTQTENDLLKALVDTNSLINARLFLVDLFGDDNELISPEKITYQKYKLGLVAENGTGELKLYIPATDVIVYSLDRKCHFTSGYSSRYVKEEIEGLSADADNEIIH